MLTEPLATEDRNGREPEARLVLVLEPETELELEDDGAEASTEEDWDEEELAE